MNKEIVELSDTRSQTCWFWQISPIQREGFIDTMFALKWLRRMSLLLLKSICVCVCVWGGGQPPLLDEG